MEQIHRYYGIQFLGDGKPKTIYMARTEAQRHQVLKWFEGSDERHEMRQVDITRPTKMPANKLGFQSLNFWMERRDQSVCA